jgi:hypothetical protein
MCIFWGTAKTKLVSGPQALRTNKLSVIRVTQLLTPPRRLVRAGGSSRHEIVSCRCRNMGMRCPGHGCPRQEGMQAALVAPQDPHADPLHRRMAPQPPLHRRRLRRLTPMPPQRTHIARARARGQRRASRPRRRLEPGASKCGRQDSQAPTRCPVGVRRTQTGQWSLLHTLGTACGHLLNSRTPTGLPCESSVSITAILKVVTLRSPRCWRACAQHLTAILRWRRPGGCRQPVVRRVRRPMSGASDLTRTGDQSCGRRG